MSRSISAAFREALYAERTGETVAILVTITHEDLAEPLRFSSDVGSLLTEDPRTYGIVSRGFIFGYFPIEELRLPEEGEDAVPAINLTMTNVGRDMVSLLRSTSTPAKVTLEVVLVSNPDQVEVSFPNFDLLNATYDAQIVTLTLGIDALTNQTYPAHSFTPSYFPALF